MIHARLLPLTSVAAVVVACSSNSPATEQGAANVQVTPGQNTSAQCPVALPDNVWSIGGDGLSPVADGSDQSGAPVKVSCAVSGNDSAGYDVTGDIELAGKGSLTLVGHVTTASGSTIRATFVLANGIGRWLEDDCSVTYPSAGGVAAGRLWAVIDCPKMVDSDHNTTCDGEATVRLENCNQ
jgi:hypothetical protein